MKSAIQRVQRRYCQDTKEVHLDQHGNSAIKPRTYNPMEVNSFEVRIPELRAITIFTVVGVSCSLAAVSTFILGIFIYFISAAYIQSDVSSILSAVCVIIILMGIVAIADMNLKKLQEAADEKFNQAIIDHTELKAIDEFSISDRTADYFFMSGRRNKFRGISRWEISKGEDHIVRAERYQHNEPVEETTLTP